MTEQGPGERRYIPPPEGITDKEITAFHEQAVRLFTIAAQPFGVFDEQETSNPDITYLDRARYRRQGKVMTVIVFDGLFLSGATETISNIGVQVDSPAPITRRWPNTYLSELFMLGNPSAPLRHSLTIDEYDLNGRLLPDRDLDAQLEAILGAVEGEGDSIEKDLEEAGELMKRYTKEKFSQLQSDFPDDMSKFVTPITPDHFIEQIDLLRGTERAHEVGYLVNPHQRRPWGS